MALHVDGVYIKSDKFNAGNQINEARFLGRTGPVSAVGPHQPDPVVGWQDYRALLMRLQKRLSNNNQYTVSYTLSRVVDNSFSGTSTGNINNVYRPELDEGYGLADRRHRLVASGAVRRAVGHHARRGLDDPDRPAIHGERRRRPRRQSQQRLRARYQEGRRQPDGHERVPRIRECLPRVAQPRGDSGVADRERQVQPDRPSRQQGRAARPLARGADRPGVQPVRQQQSRRHRRHAPDQRAVERLRPASSARRPARRARWPSG